MEHTSDRRQRRRQVTIEEIKATARRQIAREGAANFSFGAVARAMGMTPPALYRYFESRGALIVALIIDAYDSMGQALESAGEGLPSEDHAGRFLALMHAYREWAVDAPETYALMHGASMGNVEMPAEHVQAFQCAVMRSMGAMVGVLRDVDNVDHLIVPRQYREPPPSVQGALDWMRSVLQGETLPLGILALALTTWLRADGLVWQELHGHLPNALFGNGDFYAMESQILAERLGLLD